MPHALILDVLEQAMDPEPETLHVFDLPQLYSKPSTSTLLSALAVLTVEPPTWATIEASRRPMLDAKAVKPRISPDGVTDYLTKIVASSLGWIQDDAEKEAIWEAASLRLAERSGRNAMPAMERTFVIPGKSGEEDVELVVHEPSLTADNLGLKTWAASYLLAKRLRSLDLPSLRQQRAQSQQYQILELGSGTGLVGMAAAAVLSTGVLLTDLPEIEANLARNVQANRSELAMHGGIATTAVLDWSTPSALQVPAAVQLLDTRKGSAALLTGVSTVTQTAAALATLPDPGLTTPAVVPKSFPVIVVADCIYDSAHPAMLVSTIATWLSKSDDARVIIELPLRHAYLKDGKVLRDGMSAIGLVVLEEGYDSGVDDWGGDDDVREVRCWWGIWGWAG